MPNLTILICSTREQRQGIKVGEWFAGKARDHGTFDVHVADLKAIALPMLDEPNHPMKRQYQHEHTKAWSKQVEAADAFAFVTPEYNFSMPPALLNALDYLYHEWTYKPVGLVSYGGISGGLRAAQHIKSTVTALKMMPIPEGVTLPFVAKSIDASGTFAPGETPDKSVTSMLDELLKWSNALAPLRQKS
jgi:NAD(P)H-dependent FMN reductase